MELNVFVYGTLRTKQFYHHIIQEHIKQVAPATYQGTLYHLPYGYPAMILNGKGKIAGELITFQDAEMVLPKLDELEGYYGPGKDNEYERVQGEVLLEDGTLAPCELYVYPEHKREWLQREAILVSCGDWVEWKQGKEGGTKDQK